MKISSFILLMFFLGAISLEANQEIKEKLESVNETDVVLSFQLPQKATVQFFYSDQFAGINAGQSYLGIEASNLIEVPLTGLKPGTVYYFHANFYDEKNQRLYYRISWFKTAGIPELKIYSFTASESMKEVEFTVLANKTGKGTVRVDGVSGPVPLSASGIRKIPLDLSAYADSEAFTAKISGLIPGTSYTASLSFSDSSGKTVSQKMVFMTKENNVALKKKVQGTFDSKFIGDVFELEGDVLSRVTDGDFDYKTGMAVSSKNPLEEEQWVLVDLESTYPIKDIQTYWRALAYPSSYEVSLSVDGKSWSPAKKVMNDSGSETIGSMPMKVSKFDFKGQKARFVKISVPKGTKCYQRFDSYKFVQLVEMKVHPQE